MLEDGLFRLPGRIMSCVQMISARLTEIKFETEPNWFATVVAFSTPVTLLTKIIRTLLAALLRKQSYFVKRVSSR